MMVISHHLWFWLLLLFREVIEGGWGGFCNVGIVLTAVQCWCCNVGIAQTGGAMLVFSNMGIVLTWGAMLVFCNVGIVLTWGAMLVL